MEKETTIHELLYSGLEEELNRDEFIKKRNAVNRASFDKIISDIREGRIKWKKDLSEEVYATTQANVTNYKGEEVNVPVVFFSVATADGFVDRYLRIGDRNNGPCYSGEEVRQLAFDLFGLSKY